MNRSSFGRGKSTFICEVCGHRTRETGQDDDCYCGPCYELLSLQNTLWDDGVEGFKTWGVKVRDDIVAKITKRGGVVAKVKAYMTDLFAVSAD